MNGLAEAVQRVIERAECGTMRPWFDVVGRHRKRVWLCCSACRRRLRRVRVNGTVDVTRAWFCSACDPGYVVRNRTVPGSRAGFMVREQHGPR